MKKLKIISQYLTLLVFIISLLGCGEHSKTWKEEVQLSSGEIIWVNRTANYKRNIKAFITKGEGGNITQMNLTISVPENNSVAPPPPVWSFNAVPIVIDYDSVKETWFIVATYFNCNSWFEAGEPALTQWMYVVEDGTWLIYPLDGKLVGRPTNLFIGFADDKFRSIKTTKEDIGNATRHLLENNTYKKVIQKKQLCNQSAGFKPRF